MRDIRERQKLTQETVADRADLNRKTVGNAERGDYAPTLPVLFALADALDVPLSEVVRVYEERLAAR